MAFDKQRGVRLGIFLKSQEIKQVGLAKRIKTDAKFIWQIVNGYSNLTTDMAYRISKAYPELNRDWLLDGSGEMLNTDYIPPIAVEEESPKYGDPLDGLRELLHKHEQQLNEQGEQIRYLLNEMRLLRKGGRTNVKEGDGS